LQHAATIDQSRKAVLATISEKAKIVISQNHGIAAFTENADFYFSGFHEFLKKASLLFLVYRRLRITWVMTNC